MWKEDEEVVTPQQEQQEQKAYINALNGLTTGANENYTPQVEDNQTLQDYLPYTIDDEDAWFYGIKPDSRPQDVKALEENYRRENLPQTSPEQQALLDEMQRQKEQLILDRQLNDPRPFGDSAQDQAFNNYRRQGDYYASQGDLGKALENYGFLFDQMQSNAENRDEQRLKDLGLNTGAYALEQFQKDAAKANWENSYQRQLESYLNKMDVLDVLRKKNIEEGGLPAYGRDVANSDSFSVAGNNMNPFFDSDIASEYVLGANGNAYHINDSDFGDPFFDPYGVWKR